MTGDDSNQQPIRNDVSSAAGGGAAQRSAADEARLAERLEGLEKTLQNKRRAEAERVRGDEPKAGYALAVKLASEFVGGVVVGAGLGWFIDRMFGSAPWGLIVFLLLGFAAGVLNVLRAQGMVTQPGSQSGSGPGDGRGPGI